MNSIRQYIRQILLTERAMGPDDLLSEDGVVVIMGDPTGAHIYYAKEKDPSQPIKKGPGKFDPYLGEILLDDAEHQIGDGNCGGAWMIASSTALHGWGPLLYDVAMEYATINGGGLMADRGSVSSSARGVWQYYLANRGDTTGIQMDDLENTLTPEEEDNCDQDVARYSSSALQSQRGAEPDVEWTKSPLSKRWTKPPVMMNKLRSMGKLVEM